MIHDFTLVADFEPDPASVEFDEQHAAELAPLWSAIKRFEHDFFYSSVKVKGGPYEEDLELAFDVAYVLTQLPDWLKRLASGDGRATLVFGAQGSERDLIAERLGEEIVYWFQPFASVASEPIHVTVETRQFLSEWLRLSNKVMEMLLQLNAGLANDSLYQKLRIALMEVESLVSSR